MLSVIRRDGLFSNPEDSLAIPPTSLSNHGRILKKALEHQVSRIKSKLTKSNLNSKPNLNQNPTCSRSLYLFRKSSSRKADLIQGLFSKVGFKGQFGFNWFVDPSKIKFCVYYVGKEHWAGLDVIHKLTNQPGRVMQLRISLEKFSGDEATEFYDVFSVGSEVKYNY